jgi:uncharacterized membrane protein
VIWTAVLLTAVGCYAFKLSGWFVPAAWLEQPRIRTAASLLPVALLAALVVVQVFGVKQALTVDARAAALAAGAVCLWLRLPFLVMVLVAAGTAALLRAL